MIQMKTMLKVTVATDRQLLDHPATKRAVAGAIEAGIVQKGLNGIQLVDVDLLLPQPVHNCPEPDRSLLAQALDEMGSIMNEQESLKEQIKRLMLEHKRYAVQLKKVRKLATDLNRMEVKAARMGFK
jgi:hypothetical protein